MERQVPQRSRLRPTTVGVTSSVVVRRVALRRLLGSRAVAAAQGGVMAAAIALPLALHFVANLSADAGYRAAIDVSSASAMATTELVGGGSQESYSQLQNRSSNAVGTYTQHLRPISDYGTISAFNVASLNGQAFALESLPALQVTLYPTLEQRAELTAGQWPTSSSQAGPIQTTVSRSGADLYGWKVGDNICLSSVDDLAPVPTDVCMGVVGIWRPMRTSDPFWLNANSASSLTPAPAGYWSFAAQARAVRFRTFQVFQPDSATLSVADAPALEAGLKRLRAALRAGGDDLITRLDQTISVFLARSAVNQFPGQLVAAVVILVALLSLALLTQKFLTSQESQAILWRIRGWSRLDLARLLTLQLLVLAIPATVLAGASALGAAWLLSSRYGVAGPVLVSDVTSDIGLAIALSAGTALTVCVALAARFSLRTLTQMRRGTSRPLAVPWWRARNADLVGGLLAIPLLAETNLRDQAAVRSGQGSADLIGLALPAIALVLLSVAALRLVPLLVYPLRLLGSGLAGRLASWRLSRQPTEHAGAVVLLSLALAIGLFASVFATTETSNAADRAAYQTGADLRVVFGSDASPGEISDELAGIGGVAASTGVLRRQVQIASSSDIVTALGLDPETFARASWSRSGLTSPPIASALSDLSGAPSFVALPDASSELRISAIGSGAATSLEAIVRDRSGQLCTCTFGQVATQWQQLHAVVAFPRAPTYPLELQGFRLHRVGAGSGAAIQLADLVAVSGSGVAPVESFATLDGWWTRDRHGLVTAPGASSLAASGLPTLEVAVSTAGDVYLYPPFRSGPVRFLMSPATISRLALRIGDSVPLSVDSHEVVGQLAGSIDYVPTLYPGFDDFIVLPITRAVSSFALATGAAVTPNELWLALTATGQQSALDLASTSNVNFIVNRENAQILATNDPILVQLRGNLVIGFGGALLLALLGFTVHFVQAGRGRLVEHAILEANGLDPRYIRNGLAIEQVAIAGLALIVGVGLAALTAAMLLPSLQLGSSPDSVIPPTVIRVDSVGVLLVGAGGVVATALLAWLTRRIGTAVDVVDEIRKIG